eukprot:5141907-Amphidinium_carterae.2
MRRVALRLAEAFGDGPDHIIGSRADPDDVEERLGMKFVANRGLARLAGIAAGGTAAGHQLQTCSLGFRF